MAAYCFCFLDSVILNMALKGLPKAEEAKAISSIPKTVHKANLLRVAEEMARLYELYPVTVPNEVTAEMLFRQAHLVKLEVYAILGLNFDQVCS